jgi:hypothetical protein
MPGQLPRHRSGYGIFSLSNLWGFIQAGVGFVCGSPGVGAGMGLTRANATSLIVAAMTTLPCCFHFQRPGLYLCGFHPAVGLGVGAWLGSKVAVSGDQGSSVILLVAIMASAIKLTASMTSGSVCSDKSGHALRARQFHYRMPCFLLSFNL